MFYWNIIKMTADVEKRYPSRNRTKKTVQEPVIAKKVLRAKVIRKKYPKLSQEVYCAIEYIPSGEIVVCVIEENVKSLKKRQFLDDVIIHIGSNHIWKMFDKIQDKFAIMSPHFVAQCLEDGPGNEFAIKESFEAFKKPIVFLPIFRDDHWSLAIVLFGHFLFHVDSLSKNKELCHDSDVILKDLIDHINVLTEPHVIIFPINISNNPQQPNMTDCGLYMLHAIKSILLKVSNAIDDDNTDIRDLRMSLWKGQFRDWFVPAEIEELRDALFDEIASLQ